MTKPRKTNPFKPYPELVEGAEPNIQYIVRDVQHGETPHLDRTIPELATDLTPEGLISSTRHEMGHAAWSPITPPKGQDHAKRMCMLVLEDMRINMGLSRIGQELQMSKQDKYDVLRSLHASLREGPESADKVVLGTLACLFTDVEPDILSAFQAQPGWGKKLALVATMREKMSQAHKGRNKPVPNFAVVTRLANQLYNELFGEEDDAPSPQPSQGSQQQGTEQGQGQERRQDQPKKKPRRRGSTPKAREYRNKGLPAMLERSVNRQEEAFSLPDLGVCSRIVAEYSHRKATGTTTPEDRHITPIELRGAPAGEMTIEVAPMPKNHHINGQGAGLGTKFCTGYEGSVVSRIDRWPIDRAIFRRVRRMRGGTALVDISGSMRLTPEEVDEMLNQAPFATTIAVYAGQPKTGILRIVAKNGRKASIKDLRIVDHQLNVIDIPALEWLAKQPKPRIWISDGHVRGLHNEQSHYVVSTCQDIMINNDIIRVRSVWQAAEVLKKRG